MKRFLVFSILFHSVFCIKVSDQIGVITYQGIPRRERKCILGPWIHLEDGSVFHDSDRCEIKTCHITAQKAYLEVQSCRYKVDCERQILEPYFPHCCPSSPKCN